jgi:EAL domain-containing protein (putative c-di-GMP-specific phosphodiesterase class I)
MRLAERSGLIVSLGAGMLDLACRETSSWTTSAPTPDPAGPPPGLSWPITARQLDEPRAADQVLAILSSHGVEADRLTLQLTERSLQRPGATARQNLEALQRAGVRLAVRDFGAGPASLTLLLNFKVDVVKLDPIFMSGFGENDRVNAVVGSALDLGRALGIRTVARGVHVQSQVDLLRKMGCDEAQGPYFAVPLPAEDLRRMSGPARQVG